MTWARNRDDGRNRHESLCCTHTYGTVRGDSRCSCVTQHITGRHRSELLINLLITSSVPTGRRGVELCQGQLFVMQHGDT